MNDFELTKRISLLAFVEKEYPEVELIDAGGCKLYAQCFLPRHKEQNGYSFCIDSNTNKWFCNGKCNLKAGSDLVELIYQMEGVPRKEAAAWVVTNRRRWSAHERERKKYSTPQRPRPVWNWQKHLQPFPLHCVAELSEQRGIGRRGVREAMQRGLLWYIESYQGPAWLITDKNRKQAIWRRLNGEDWDGGGKSRNLPGCSGRTPIGIEESLSYNVLMVVEGGPDLLAALDWWPDRGVICLPNGHSRFMSDDALRLRRKNVIILPHGDAVGLAAKDNWLGQLIGAKWMNFHLQGGSIDLNEWVAKQT